MKNAKAIYAQRLFDGVDTDDCERIRIALDLSVRSLAAGEILAEADRRTDVFWLLLSGSLQGARCYLDGSIDLVQFYTGGDIICLDVVCTRTRRSPLQISAVGGAEVVAVDYDALLNVKSEGARLSAAREIIGANIVRLLADESIRKQYKIDVLYKKSLRTRILTFLHHMKSKASSPSFDIGMDREMLAQYLGVNRSALSHELSLMRKDGLIEFRKSRFVLKSGGLEPGK
jgi:CRP-like cAMP-binding protein